MVLLQNVTKYDSKFRRLALQTTFVWLAQTLAIQMTFVWCIVCSVHVFAHDRSRRVVDSPLCELYSP